MSKWVKDKEKLFSEFQERKRYETEQASAGPRRRDVVWRTPARGTQEKPRTYVIRPIPDPNGNFYKDFLYHMFKAVSGEWVFALCPKTHGYHEYCPLCAATMKLFQGSTEDKEAARNYKRKSKHVCNTYIVKDPRDSDAESLEEEVSGKVLVYEFPDKVEGKLKSEITDKEYGLGIKIFDPGADGIDFVLKVGSTKPTQNGQIFHDYSESKFATEAYPLGNDEKIQDIMNNTHDLDEYIKSMERSESEMIEIVKKEMLWNLIENDYKENGSRKPDPGPTTRAKTSENIDEDPFQDRVPDKEKSSESEPEPETENISDEDLLEDLKNL